MAIWFKKDASARENRAGRMSRSRSGLWESLTAELSKKEDMTIRNGFAHGGERRKPAIAPVTGAWPHRLHQVERAALHEAPVALPSHVLPVLDDHLAPRKDVRWRSDHFLALVRRV